jgi:hypothetical protein
MGVSVKGVVGQIKWAYYNAAAINGYAVSRGADGAWTLSGTVVTSDSFKMAQRPLIFVAPHAKGEWRWPIEQLSIVNGRVTATLGQPLP